MTVKQVLPVHSFSVNKIRVDTYHLNAGEGLPEHTHAYSHVTQCHAGSIIVRKENKQLIMTKETKPVNLIAGEWHEIEALEDGTVVSNSGAII